MTTRRHRLLVVGTRASKLALWQTNFVIGKLKGFFPDLECRMQTFKTTGDDIVDRPLPELGGKGVFTESLERALLSGEVDIAVHSLKDLPIESTPGLELGAITSRVDVRDVLVTRDGVDFRSLPRGARVGTSSLRRQAQLLHERPDLQTAPIRGNVETRIRKVTQGDYDATVLAAAGVDRLGLGAVVSDRLDLGLMLPAPGQGALAVQCRSDDRSTLELLAALDDANDRATALAERAFLAALGGGCSAPVAAWAEITANGDVRMKGLVARPDGTERVLVEGSGPDGPALAAELANEAIAQGARAILDAAREDIDNKLPLKNKRVVVTRPADQSASFCDALSGLGATPVRLPMIRIVPTATQQAIDQVARAANPGDWVVFTSANGVSVVGPFLNGDRLGAARIAAVGTSTASALEERTILPDFVPEEFTGEAVGRGMPDIAGKNVWLLRAEAAGEDLVAVLVDRGAVVHDVPVYRTETVTIDAAGMDELNQGVDVITFTSGSTARHFYQVCQETGVQVDGRAVIACIGPVTAKTVRELGFKVDIVAGEHTTSGLIDALANHFSEVS